MELSEFISPQLTKLELTSTTKLDAIKELIDMHRVGFKYKINHNTKDLIAFRNFLDNEIKRRKEGGLNGQKNISESHKQTQD